MGVLGLWQLLNPVGQPVTLESLENKILAVDISIWLNQAVKGYRDSKGGAITNAHLLSLFSRLCKLLFYKIRPIIVFDGGVPEQKKQTIINRQQRRAALKESSKDAGLKLLANYLANQNIEKSKNKKTQNSFLASKSSVRDDIYILPPLDKISGSHSVEELGNELDFHHEYLSQDELKYLNEIDIESSDFEALPVDIKQEILSTLKETKKHKNWEYYETLPKESEEFSSYQMQCLLKRRQLQNKIEEVQRNVQKAHCLDIISLYADDQEMIGASSKIMSDECSHYIFLKKIVHDGDETKERQTTESKLNTGNTSKINKESFESNRIQQEELELQNNNYESKVNNEIEIAVSDTGLSYSSIDPYAHDDSNSVSSNSCSNMPSKSHTECVEQDSDDYPVNSDNISNKISQLSEAEKNLKEQVMSNAAILENQNVSNNDNAHCLKPIKDTPTFASSCLNSESLNLAQESCDSNCVNVEFNKSVLKDSILSDKCSTLPDKQKQLDFAVKTECLPENSNIIHHLFSEDNKITTPISISQNIPDLGTEISEIHSAVQRELEEATSSLKAQQAKSERQASTVQEHMVEECKDMLRLFGVPYIVSPMEAEAQCAFYDLQEITDGTITDDSDIWLFGGKRVYKNFFAQKKYVEFFTDSEILSHFGLNRMKLINFAMLTGSDYTEGIMGVGPVTAMEIISEFGSDGIKALSDFKAWWTEANKHASPPKNKVRAKLQRLPVSEAFPNKAIVETYLNPKIDDSTESFSWGLPDLDALRDFAREKFGWNKSKVDDVLLPVIKRLNERTVQTHLDSFFTIRLKKEKNLFPSKRVMSALKKIHPSEEECDNPKSKVLKKGSKQKSSRKKSNRTASQKGTMRLSSSVKTRHAVQLSEDSTSDSG